MQIKNSEKRRFYEIEATSLQTLHRQYNSSLYKRLTLSRNKDEVNAISNNDVVYDVVNSYKSLLEKVMREKSHRA